jgi:hypothetical protein
VSAKSTAKSLGKRLALPFTRRVYGRIDFRADQLREEIQAVPAAVDRLQQEIEAVPAVVDQRTAELQADIEALNRYLPTVVNTIASQNAASRETERKLRALSTRLDALEHPNAVPASTVSARVTNEEMVRRMRGNLRLNVSTGDVVREGYLNVGSRELPGIDMVADVRDLPFDEEGVAEIYSAHVLERFSLEELRRVVLPSWVSLLEDGGKLVSIVADVETMVAEHAAGRMPFEDFINVMYGEQGSDDDVRVSGFSQETLTRLLEEVGLEDVKVIEEGRRNGASYEMEIEAVRRRPTSG